MCFRVTQVNEADDQNKRNDDLDMHMHMHDMMEMHDDAVFVNNDLGGKDEPDVPYDDDGDRYQSNNWLVPSRPVDESKLKKNFDPDSVAAAVVPSPMWGIRLNNTYMGDEY